MPLSYFKRPLAVAAFLYITVLAGLNALGCFRTAAPLRLRAYARERTVTLEGRVLSGFSPKRWGDRFLIRALRTEGRGHEPVRVMAYLSRSDPDTARLRPGHLVRLRGKLRLPRRPRNPGSFDEAAFLERRGAAFVLRARSVELLPGRVPLRWRPWAWGCRVHRSIHAYFERRFEPTTAVLLEGLILGSKGSLPPELSRDIQDSGLMHLLTPSGAKVTAVTAAALLLAWGLGVPPRWRLAPAALCGGLYLLAAGPEPPHARAFVMTLVLAASCLAGRGSGAFQGLALSAVLLPMLEPRTVLTAGYQLTHLAMLGILIALPRWSLPRRWPFPLRRALQALMISFVVQLMLWPTFSRFFGRGSLVGLAANALVVPLSGLGMLSGAAAWASSFTPLAPLERCCAAAAGAWAALFVKVCGACADLPFAAVDIGPMGAAAVLSYYLLVFGVLVLPSWKVSLRFWACAASVVLVFGLHSRLRAPRARILFLGGWNTRAAVVSLPGKGHRLHGTATPSVLRGVKRALGVRRLERAPARLDLRFGDLRVDWDGECAAVSTAARGEYCIMTAPSGNRPRRCPYRRTLSTRMEGAVRVSSDGEDFEITTQEDRHPFGRAVL